MTEKPRAKRGGTQTRAKPGPKTGLGPKSTRPVTLSMQESTKQRLAEAADATDLSKSGVAERVLVRHLDDFVAVYPLEKALLTALEEDTERS